jgi:hypothetical protein
MWRELRLARVQSSAQGRRRSGGARVGASRCFARARGSWRRAGRDAWWLVRPVLVQCAPLELTGMTRSNSHVLTAVRWAGVIESRKETNGDPMGPRRPLRRSVSRLGIRAVDPLLTMEALASGYVISQEDSLAGFPCNLVGFSACHSLSLKALEPTRKASNLSPRPSPKRAAGRGARPRSATFHGSCAWAFHRLL